MSEELSWTVTLLTEALPCERCEAYLKWEAEKYQPKDTDYKGLPNHTGDDHVARRTTYMSGFPAPSPDPTRVRHTLRVVHKALATVAFEGTPLEVIDRFAERNVIIGSATAIKLGMEMERVWNTRAGIPVRSR